jgi:hypothetical protein
MLMKNKPTTKTVRAKARVQISDLKPRKNPKAGDGYTLLTRTYTLRNSNLP